MIEFGLQYQEKLISGEKQFNYQCRCSFLEVNQYLSFLYKASQNSNLSWSLNVGNVFLPFIWLCFKTDIQRTNWQFTQSYSAEP